MCHLSIFLSSLANTLINPKSCHCGLEYLQCRRVPKNGKELLGKISGRVVKWFWLVKFSVLPHCKANILLVLYREIYLDFAVITLSLQELCSREVAAKLLLVWCRDGILSWAAESRRVSEEAALCAFQWVKMEKQSLFLAECDIWLRVVVGLLSGRRWWMLVQGFALMRGMAPVWHACPHVKWLTVLSNPCAELDSS